MNESKKAKKAKKAFILSLCSLWICIIAFVGSSYAWFIDVIANNNNKIIAGNLDVELYHSNSIPREKVTGETKLFNVPLWEPGVVAYENFEIVNEGDLTFNYKFAMNILNFNVVADSEKSLKDVLKVAVIDGEFSGNREDINSLDFSQNIGDIAKENTLNVKGESNKFAIVVYWAPSEVDNDYNLSGDKTSNNGEPLFIDLGVNLVATQNTYEQDSFDNQYDVDAGKLNVNMDYIASK